MAATVPRTEQAGKAQSPAREKPGAAKPRKLGFNQARELEAMPARIQALEAEQAQLGARLADPALYAKPPQDVRQLQQRYAAIEEELTACLTRWEELEAMRDRAGA